MCKHFSVIVPNKLGELSKIAELLSVNNVNILGYHLSADKDFGVAYFLTDPHRKGFECIREKYRYYCNERHVVIVKADHSTGQLSGLLKVLGEKGINIENSYQASTIDHQIVIVLEIRQQPLTNECEQELDRLGFSVYMDQPTA